MRSTDPTHPGEVLREDFLVPHGLSAGRLARRLGVPRRRIGDLVRGRRGMTADTALRLERAFGVSAQFWMTLQQQHDLIVAKGKAGADLDRIGRVAA